MEEREVPAVAAAAAASEDDSVVAAAAAAPEEVVALRDRPLYLELSRTQRLDEIAAAPSGYAPPPADEKAWFESVKAQYLALGFSTSPAESAGQPGYADLLLFNVYLNREGKLVADGREGAPATGEVDSLLKDVPTGIFLGYKTWLAERVEAASCLQPPEAGGGDVGFVMMPSPSLTDGARHIVPISPIRDLVVAAANEILEKKRAGLLEPNLHTGICCQTLIELEKAITGNSELSGFLIRGDLKDADEAAKRIRTVTNVLGNHPNNLFMGDDAINKKIRDRIDLAYDVAGGLALLDPEGKPRVNDEERGRTAGRYYTWLRANKPFDRVHEWYKMYGRFVGLKVAKPLQGVRDCSTVADAAALGAVYQCEGADAKVLDGPLRDLRGHLDTYNKWVAKERESYGGPPPDKIPGFHGAIAIDGLAVRGKPGKVIGTQAKRHQAVVGTYPMRDEVDLPGFTRPLRRQDTARVEAIEAVNLRQLASTRETELQMEEVRLVARVEAVIPAIPEEEQVLAGGDTPPLSPGDDNPAPAAEAKGTKRKKPEPGEEDSQSVSRSDSKVPTTVDGVSKVRRLAEELAQEPKPQDEDVDVDEGRHTPSDDMN